jgi:hypothetical protein
MKSKSLKDYEVIIASDVHTRDGIGIEIWHDDKLLIEVFRDDGNKQYTFSTYENDLPLELVEECISHFKEEIPDEFQE